MTKRMLIDATHAEETRVVVLDGNRLEDFDVETSTKRQLKGNIYLAKVVRVEPSLQAAFVEYGGNRHGFLAFSEIHPDYYQIPVADRQRLIEQEAEEAQREEEEADREMEGRAADHSCAASSAAPAPIETGWRRPAQWRLGPVRRPAQSETAECRPAQRRRPEARNRRDGAATAAECRATTAGPDRCRRPTPKRRRQRQGDSVAGAPRRPRPSDSATAIWPRRPRRMAARQRRRRTPG